jgi:FkbM family methyltransferase
MFITGYVKSYVKNKLRPYVKGTARNLVHRALGYKTTPLSRAEIASLVKKPDPTILEIGCNSGGDTLAMLRAMPEAKIYCFEPDPRAVARFRKKLGSDFERVKLFEIAVSDRSGKIEFHTSGGGAFPEGFDQSGSIRRPKNHLVEYPGVSFEKTITVQTLTLDDWCSQNDIANVDFIWMDVQGAEGDVIAGARNILQKTRVLYTEYSNNELYEGQLSLKKLLAHLPSFDVIAKYPGDVLLRNRSL